MRALRPALLTLLVLLGSGIEVHAQDRSGVRPEVLSLPDGPGSIEGLGESFEPSAATGTSSYSVSITVPPGVVGFQPSLALRYSSGAGNGELGLGWSMGLPVVQRGTDRGLPRYDDSDTIVLRGMGGGAEDLVQLADGSWRFRIEGAFVRGRRRDDGSWEFRNRSGIRFRFGTTDTSTVRDGARVFAWMLTEQEDTHGHVIRYEWERNDVGQPELARVVYNDFSPEVRNVVAFEREARPDVITSYVSTFPVTTSRRIARIVVTHGGELVRRYELGYSMMLGLSRLSTVRMVGSDGATALPTLTLDYVEFAPDSSELVTMENAPARALGEVAEIDDVDGDALPDLLVTDPTLDGGRYSWVPNLDGAVWGERRVMTGSPSVWLSATGVQLADMDGDGAADVVARLSSASDGFRYYPASLDGKSLGEAVVITPAPSFGFDDPDVRLADLDHDRRTDWMRIDPTTGEAWVAFNSGAGNFTPAVSVGRLEPSEVLSFSRSGLQLADMNGDGLVDLVALRSGSLRYWPSRGRGRFDEGVSLAGAPTLSDGELAATQVRDLNGDGTADIVHVGTGRVRYWLNLAGRSLMPVMDLDGTPELRPTTIVRVADMNGNGTADIVWIDPASSTPWRYLDVLPRGTPGLLSSVDNGLGRLTRIRYAGMGDMRRWARDQGVEWEHRSPIGQTVVHTVETESGLDALVRYELFYASPYYDGDSREFRGFATSLRVDPGDAEQPTLVTETRFDVGATDEALKGMARFVERRADDGDVFDTEVSTHSVRTVASSAAGEPVRYGFRQRLERLIYELGSEPVVTRTEWDQDDYGNTIREARYGIVEGDDVAAGDDETITVRTYAVEPSQWIVDRIASERVESVSGQRVSERRTYYDGPAFEGLPLGGLGSSGDVTRIESWIEDERFADEARHERDSHGNVIATLDARGARREVEYDEVDHTFPIRESVEVEAGLRLTFHAQHDRALGVITSLTELNGHVTSVGYDELGRTVQIVRPGDDEERPTQRFEYTLGAPLSQVRVEQRQRSGEDHVVLEIRHVDGLGRARGSFVRTDDGRWAASGLVEHGARGWVARAARPSFERSADVVALESRPTPRQEYDALGRTIRSIDVDESETRTEHGPLWRREWDANDSDGDSPHQGTPTTYYDDGLARIRRVVQLDETREVPTFFHYDPLGNLTRMIDAEMRVRRYVYDGRSRRVRVEDPNAGTWRFEHTDGDDLHVRHDPAGHRVRYEHDVLGRPLEEWHQLAGDEERRAVLYHYDLAHEDHPSLGNTLGQLAWVEDDAGAVFLGYDARGRLTDRIRRFPDGQEHLTWTDYDAADRPLRRGFPDGTHVETRNDERGLLREVGGLVRELTWTAWGGLDTATYGNGIVDARSYDDRQRLRRMSATSGAEILRDIEYTLDVASRIQSIADGRPGVPAAENLGFSTLEYDDLYRLVRAVDAVGETEWAYDDVANILSISSTHDAPFLNVVNRYGEDGAGPDQLTHWGDERFEYDDAGRVIWDGERTFEWDAEGRLSRVMRGDLVEEYVYGFDDERTIKRSRTPTGTDETRYVDRDVEIRAGGMVRYVFLGEERAIRIDDVPDDPTSMAASVVRVSDVGSTTVLLALGSVLVLVLVTRRRHAVVLLLAMSSCGEPTESVRDRSVPITEWPASAVLYLSDLAATPVALADARGSVVQRWAHHPYGAVRVEQGDIAEPYGYVGNERDRVSGLSDFNARPYRPEVGRFLAVDPVLVMMIPDPSTVAPIAFSAYSYAGGDPVNAHDRTGLFVFGIGGVVSGSSGFGVSGGSGFYFEIRLTGPRPGIDIGTYRSASFSAGLQGGLSAGVQFTIAPTASARDVWGDMSPSVSVGGAVGVGGSVELQPGAVAVTISGGAEFEVAGAVGGGETSSLRNWGGESEETPEPARGRRYREGRGERGMDAGPMADGGMVNGSYPTAPPSPPTVDADALMSRPPEDLMSSDPSCEAVSCG